MEKLILKPLFCCVVLISVLSCFHQGPDMDCDADTSVMKDSVAWYRTEGKNLRNAAKYQNAIAVHTRGLELAKEIGDTLEVVQALNNIGTVYRRMGLLDDAASWHYQALTWCEEWSDKTSDIALKNRVISLNGIGNVHLSMGSSDIAMQAFREALKGETRLGSATGMAINYANIGALIEEKGDIDSARWYYSQSLKYNTESGNTLGIALCNNHFGRLSEMQGDLESASKEYGKAYDILLGGTDKWHWLQSCTALARISIQQSRHAQAGKYINEGLEVAEEAGSLEHLLDLTLLKYRLCRATGDYSEALTWLEKHKDISESIAAERNEDEIYNLRTAYEHEKNRNEMKHLLQMHSQENRRKNMMLVSLVVILLLSSVGIGVLVYALRLRARNHKMLDELNQTRNNYFTNIAHEFRTPLTVILSAARSINRNAEDEETVREDSKDILTHSRDLLDLVNQVMEVARMTSALAPEPVWRNGNVTGYVAAVCERYARFAQEKRIDLVQDFGSQEIEMDFIPDMLGRIVSNLVSNALKYSPAGSVVTVSLNEIVKDGKKHLQLLVSDKGKGMTAKQMENIFKPFYRASGGSGDAGTGIGLYVVKLSAEAMGGSSCVRSVVGEGTDFDIMIPIRHDKAVEACSVPDPDDMVCETAADVIENSTAVNAGEESPRILIVEDRPEVARWEMRQLDSRYSFWFASDGAEGLRLAEEIVPDLIITDIMMPVMDGFEMCRRVRASELLSHIPVIMVTAKAGQEDRIAGFEAGADAYIEKPYDEEELSVRVRTLLDQRERLKLRYSSHTDESTSDSDLRGYSVMDQAFLDRFNEIVEASFAKGKVDCEAIASELCVGRVQLNRKIKAITGCKTTEYIHELRIAKAKDLLERTPLSIGEVALKCGIEDVGYFSTLFRKAVGMTPSAYRNR